MQKIKEFFQKVASFFKGKDIKMIGLGLFSFLCLIGAVNGVAYAICSHEYFTAFCILPLASCACVTLVGWWKKVLE